MKHKQQQKILKILLIIFIVFVVLKCTCIAKEHWFLMPPKKDEDDGGDLATIGAMINEVQANQGELDREVQANQRELNRECIEIDGACHEWKHHPNHDYGQWGVKLDMIPGTATPESCKELCESDTTCRGFSINNSGNDPTCWTKVRTIATNPDGSSDPTGRSIISRGDLDAYELTPY
jgi:hypothetical protein